MGELAIRRNRGIPVPRYQETGKAEKASASSSSPKVAKGTGYTVSKTLQELMSRVSQAEAHTRESRRTLRTGEAALAEVQDNLGRMAELAGKAAGDGEADRPALQAQLDQLREEIDRILRGAVVGDTRLFLDEDGVTEGTEALLDALLNTGEGNNASGVQELPNWLTNALVQDAMTPEQLLTALGLDKNASGAEILAAIADSSLESNSAAGYLAALYLGAVIANGTSAGTIDPDQALEGLRKFMESVESGLTPDEAIQQLTNGEFTSLEDFQGQFRAGSAPGLSEFLNTLLLSGGEAGLLPGDPLLTLLAGTGGMDLDLMMGLLNALQTSGDSSAAAQNAAQEMAAGSPMTETAGAAASPASVLDFGAVRVSGQDLSGVSFDQSAGELLVRGTADVTIQGTGQNGPTIRLSGSGTVTLENVQAASLTVEHSETGAAHIFSAGQTVLGDVQLKPGAALILSGGGLVKTGVFHADGSNRLHLINGAALAVEGDGKTPGVLTLPVVLDGPVSLSAQVQGSVTTGGKAAEPFDILWKTLLPGWDSITALEINGRQAKMALAFSDPARLWLAKGDASHGSPIHTVVVRGKDSSGRPKTRYAYLHWNRQDGAFEERSLYPNPFTITGGMAGRDWYYEEDSHTLCILTNQVTGISGGAGTDANQASFSGRIALADNIGEIELALGGVACRVDSGQAFRLGCGNDVVLLLQNQTENHFESGEGCAGISLGDGASLRIDCPDSRGGSRNPPGSLTAVGGEGGAGIGRDSGAGRDRTCRILIRGGVITATGTGGGAGIGAGKHSFIGPIIILGGTVHSTGGTGGGAGIGGALGASAGDISIRGGKITAVATDHAAAIGAGVQGACGDILITGTARVLKALGGNPGADIGACLFGGCGKVLVSGAADIGGAKLRTKAGVSLQMGEDAVTLPQFRLSSRALQLDKLRVTTQEAARAAQAAIDTDRRWVGQVQNAYGTFYTRLEKSFRSLRSFHAHSGGSEGPLRDAAAAGSLLADTRQSIPSQSPKTTIREWEQWGLEEIQKLLR